MFWVQGPSKIWRRVSDDAGMRLMGILEDSKHPEHHEYADGWRVAEIRRGPDAGFEIESGADGFDLFVMGVWGFFGTGLAIGMMLWKCCS